jgi:nucleotide-binding universal stress UspA family protein
MASILVATDCSGELDEAVECGLALSGQLGFETVIVHVAGSDVDETRLAEARQALQTRSGRAEVGSALMF